MRRRASGGAIGVGLLAALAYVGLAAVTFSLRPLSGRPVLDGLAPPPPYRWVSPPEALARTNIPPEPADFSIPLNDAGSEPGVFSTPDLQLSASFPTGTFRPVEGQRSIMLTATPLAPADVGPPPPGLEIKGNVVRLEGRLRPSDATVEEFALPAQLALTYPAEPDGALLAYTVVSSADGRTWRRLKTIDSPAQHRAGADFRSFGYFAVAAPPRSGGPSVVLVAAVVGGALAMAAVVALVLWRRRRERERVARMRGKKSKSRGRRR